MYGTSCLGMLDLGDVRLAHASTQRTATPWHASVANARSAPNGLRVRLPCQQAGSTMATMMQQDAKAVPQYQANGALALGA